MAEYGLNQRFHEFMLKEFDEFKAEESMQNLPLLHHVKQWIFDNIKDWNDWGDIVEMPSFFYQPQFDIFDDDDDDYDYDEEELVYDGGHDWDDLNANPVSD